MINPKYDLNNYIKHLAIPVITDNQKIKQLFKSSLLRVKWFHNPLTRQSLNTVGILRIHVNTPFGLLRPQDYSVQIDTAKNTYIQFLSITPRPDFDYEIEVIHPTGITRSMLEIWEFIEPQTFTNFSSTMPVYGQDDTATNALIAATNANTAAISAMASANPTADAIADAIANNSVITPQSAVVLVGTSLISILAKSLNTQSVTIKNTSTSKIKIWVSDTVPTIATGSIVYSTPGETVELATSTGVYEVPLASAKSGIYAIANNANGSVSVTRTYTN